jgi:hypothetical protein
MSGEISTDVDPITLVGRRVRSKSQVKLEGDKVRVLMTAFLEGRQNSGGTSIDILWPTIPEQKQGLKDERLTGVSTVCAAEGFKVVGLAAFKVQEVLKHVKAVKRVIANATKTNALHGELVPQNFMAIVEVNADAENAAELVEENEARAESLALLLSQFHAKHGHYFELTPVEKV